MKEILAIMGIIAVLFVSVQYAEAQQILIEGENNKNGIFIAIEGRDNIMMWETKDGYAEFFDSKLKMYKSGGFSIKNPDGSIAVWGHPFNETQYKLVILTSEGVSRIIANVIEQKPVEIVTQSSEGVIVPKSSIGADITKWNIPTDTTRDHQREPRIIAYLDSINQVFINDEYTPHIKIENQDFKKIPADVTLEITRDGYTIKKISKSVRYGVWSPVINVLDDYYTPSFCYTVTVTATSGNYTDIATDDFTVVTTAKYWDSTINPIKADSKCNR